MMGLSVGSAHQTRYPRSQSATVKPTNGKTALNQVPFLRRNWNDIA